MRYIFGTLCMYALIIAIRELALIYENGVLRYSTLVTFIDVYQEYNEE